MALSSSLFRRHHFAVDVEHASRKMGRTIHQQSPSIAMI